MSGAVSRSPGFVGADHHELCHFTSICTPSQVGFVYGLRGFIILSAFCSARVLVWQVTGN
jgi:hypothetical protein